MTQHFNSNLNSHPEPAALPSSPPALLAQALVVYSVYCIIDNCVYYMFKNILLVIFEAFKLNKIQLYF